LRLTEGDYLKRAAALLFHPEPQKFFSGAFVKIGYFKSGSDLRYHDVLEGNLFDQLDRTMDLLLTKYTRAAIRITGRGREELFPLPEPALREAVVNAIAHKDYSSGNPIQISVYDDRIVIWNDGHLPENWTIKDLLGKHASIPFNPDIARVFFLAGKIEAWGSGIERMFAACRKHGCPEPVLCPEPVGLMATLHFLPRAVSEKTGEKQAGTTSRDQAGTKWGAI
jgi:ATP-dependent DNA helicase RecG